jgi:hypothetical protein
MESRNRPSTGSSLEKRSGGEENPVRFRTQRVRSLPSDEKQTAIGTKRCSQRFSSRALPRPLWKEGRAMTVPKARSIRSDEAGDAVVHTTLLDLMWRTAEETDGESELVADVEQRLREGSVQLTGNFRDVPVERLLS